MTLKTHIIQYLKSYDGWIAGISLSRVMFKTTRGGYFSPESIARTLRELSKEIPERIEQKFEGVVKYRYIKSDYEKFNENQAR